MANAQAPALIVAQSGSTAAGDVVLWVGTLILAVIIGAAMAMFFRSRILSSKDDASTDKGVFDSLRRMHERGEISDEEFNAARDSVIKRLRTKPSSENPDAPRSGESKVVEPTKARGEDPTPESDEPERVFRAKPGHDLFGRPLPGSGGAGNDGPDAGPAKKPEK